MDLMGAMEKQVSRCEDQSNRYSKHSSKNKNYNHQNLSPPLILLLYVLIGSSTIIEIVIVLSIL